MGQYEFPNPEWSDVSEEGKLYVVLHLDVYWELEALSLHVKALLLNFKRNSTIKYVWVQADQVLKDKGPFFKK